MLRLVCFIFIFFFSGIYLVWGNNNVDNKLLKQYPEGRVKAEEVYKSFYNTINEPNKLADYWMNPLVGKGTLKTVNGTAVGGNTTLLCASGKGGRKVLELNVLPMGTGDLRVYVTWEVIEGQKKIMNFDTVSAPCANGVIICNHPNAFTNCNYYIIDYDSNTDRFYLTNTTKVRVPGPGGNGTVEQEVPVTYSALASPCVCVKNVCGAGIRNSFAANPGYILQLLGGAFVSALQAKRPDFILTNAEIEGYTIRYYGQNQRECDGVESSSYVQELTSYRYNTEALEMKGSEMYFSLRTATNNPVFSAYTLYETLKNNMTNFDLYSCTKRHIVIPQTYSLSDLQGSVTSECGQDVPFFEAVGDKIIILKIIGRQVGGGTGRVYFSFDLFPDLIHKLSRVIVRFCKHKSNSGGCFDDDSCVRVTLNGYSGTAGCSRQTNGDFSFEIPASVLKLNGNTGVIEVSYVGGRVLGFKKDRHPTTCNGIVTFIFHFSEPLDFCFIKDEYGENNCQSYENDPNCVLYEEYYIPPKTGERVPLVVTGMRTGYKPLDHCMAICPTLEICRDDWAFERKYRCKKEPIDYSDLVKRQEHVKSTLGISGNTEITFEDLRKMQNRWQVFGNNRLALPLGSETDDCMNVCKVSRPHLTREVERDMSVRGYDKPKEKEI
ncbi:MAG: hypothetical protein QXR31_00655, partial [Zestosphaera sp.]